MARPVTTGAWGRRVVSGTGGGAFTAQKNLGDRAFRVDGLKEFEHLVNNINPKVTNQIIKTAVHATAGKVRDGMRQRVKSFKDTGTLYKAIHTKRRRGEPGEAVSDVRIAHGKGVKHDAYYWHFIEFEYGGVKRPATPFIRPTIEDFAPRLNSIYQQQFVRKVKQRLEREARKQRSR